MELQEIKPRNLTDQVLESMSVAEPDIYVEPLYRPTPDVELPLEPEPINHRHENGPYTTVHGRTQTVQESIYENPYSTHIYHNFGGSRIPFRNYDNEESRNRKWSISCLIIGLLVGIVIGGTVTGLSMHFTKGQSNSQFKIAIFYLIKFIK